MRFFFINRLAHNAYNELDEFFIKRAYSVGSNEGVFRLLGTLNKNSNVFSAFAMECLRFAKLFIPPF